MPRTSSPLMHPSAPAIRRLALALGITLGFVALEAIAAWYSGSLAILTDATHNLTDVAALALSWYALRLESRPANPSRTYGYHRVGILIALVNAASVIALTIWIFYEAYQRWISPPEIRTDWMIATAGVALLVNLGTAWLVWRGSHANLNLRSAFLHLTGDALSSLGAILAGIGIAISGMRVLDPLASIFIGLVIVWSAWGVLRESVEILLEGVPRDMDMPALVGDLQLIPGVLGVHDLHVWSINHQVRALSAHLITKDLPVSHGAEIQRQVNEMLREKYAITHATLQLECSGCEPDLLYCDLGQSPKPHSQVEHLAKK